jgi:hypothetical protein
MAGGGDPRMGGGMNMGGGAGKDAKTPVVTQLRTDFLIQFIWQPPTLEKPAKSIEETRKALIEAENDPKNLEAIRAFDSSKIEEQLQKVSEKGSEGVVAKINEAAKAAGQGGPGQPTPPAGGPGGLPNSPGAPPAGGPGAPR